MNGASPKNLISSLSLSLSLSLSPVREEGSPHLVHVTRAHASLHGDSLPRLPVLDPLPCYIMFCSSHVQDPRLLSTSLLPPTPPSLRSFVRSFVPSFLRSFVRSFVRSFLRSFLLSFLPHPPTVPTPTPPSPAGLPGARPARSPPTAAPRPLPRTIPCAEWYSPPLAEPPPR